MSEATCLFCKIRDQQIPADVVYRDAHVLAFKDLTPQAPLHLLVIPLRHIPTLVDALPVDAEILGRLTLIGARLSGEAGFAESGFRVVMNTGPAAGQSVFHIHLHDLAGRVLQWPPG